MRRQQKSFCALDQLRSAKPVESQLSKAVFQMGFGVRRERHEAEVLAHPGTNGAVACLSDQARQPGGRMDVDLLREMNNGLVRDAFGVIGEAPGAAKAAQMQRGPQAPQAAGALDLIKIALGERPIAQQRIEIGLVPRCIQHVSRRD